MDKINTPKTRLNTQKIIKLNGEHLSHASILKAFTCPRNLLLNSIRFIHTSTHIITEILNTINQNQNVGV